MKVRSPRRRNTFNAASACVGKTRWATEKTAQAAITRLRRENPDAISSTVRPYRCSSGRKPHWHVGHGW